MSQKQPLEILRDNLRKLDKEELIDMLISIMETSLAAAIANSKLNIQKLNNVIAEQNCSFRTIRTSEVKSNCMEIEQSLNEIIQIYKDEKNA